MVATGGLLPLKYLILPQYEFFKLAISLPF